RYHAWSNRRIEMAFSLRTVLLAIAISSLWLGAVVTRSPVLLELASVSSLLLLFLAIPLSFYDHENRKPFWAGFAAIGLGLMLAATFFDLPLHKTSSAITEFAMSIPGVGNIPDSTTTNVVPVSYIGENGGVTTPTMSPMTTTISIHDAINRTVPFLLIMMFATFGGLFVKHAASLRKPQTENA
ncbi:MAG: hypothetical protein AAF978_10020, partial [Cyanobacteria bacterium P01_E01_bin.48]